MNAVGLVILAVGAVLLALSARRLTAANPTERLPTWRNPAETPGRAIALRAIGIGLVIFGVGVATSHFGQGGTLILLAWVPFLLVHVTHNRRVRTRSGT